MNENLERLLPNPFAVDYIGTDEPIDIYTEKEMLEFAEIIIKKCVIVCKTGGVSNSDYNTGRLHCVYDIKQYFGVE